MATLQQHLIKIDGAQLEVYTGATDDVIVCTAHPAFGETADGGILTDPFVDIAQVVTVSPRGIGASSPGPITLSQFVEDLETVRRSLGIGSWIFAGPSAGGAIGLLYALHFPHALKGLILSVTTPSWPQVFADPLSILSPQNAAWRDEIVAQLPRLESKVLPQGHTSLVQIRADLWTLLDQSGPRVILQGEEDTEHWKVWWNEALHFDVTARLQEIRMPTLIIAGKRDELVPVSNMLLLHKHIANSELVVFEECGHTPMLEASEKYRMELRRFLGQFRD